MSHSVPDYFYSTAQTQCHFVTSVVIWGCLFIRNWTKTPSGLFHMDLAICWHFCGPNTNQWPGMARRHFPLSVYSYFNFPSTGCFEWPDFPLLQGAAGDCT